MNDIKREKSNMELWAEEEIRIACERESEVILRKMNGIMAGPATKVR